MRAPFEAGSRRLNCSLPDLYRRNASVRSGDPVLDIASAGTAQGVGRNWPLLLPRPPRGRRPTFPAKLLPAKRACLLGAPDCGLVFDRTHSTVEAKEMN